MALYICSLVMNAAQTVPSQSAYYNVRFDYETPTADHWEMHRPNQPDGGTSVSGDERSSLIWPQVAGWATVIGYAVWNYNASWSATQEVRAQFCRDPLNLTTGADSTATVDDANTPGGQYKHYMHQMFVSPNTPVSFQLKHQSGVPAVISHAQFKMAIESDVAYP
ncbi:hypothetical protein [Streptomyces sp. NPDC002855]|uniref:hypothetical protein n=1 Tax=Streptomyces sp. NPDC002855 TaxID=3154437 RepID=UPI00331C351D